MVSDKKQKIVQGLAKDIKEYPIVGVLNLENLPAQQLQKMRSTLAKSDVKIIMTRKKLIRKALEKSAHSNVLDLSEKLVGMPALLFAKSNPFSLYKILQKNKSEAPAKAGQTAPKEIIVRAGQTNFAPGPIISELASVGIKTKVEGGKLAIISDTVVAKEGDKISSKLAETLKRLDIKPMEIGLNLVAVWEDGTIFLAKQLDVNEVEYFTKFAQAAQWAVSLSMEAAYPTSETVELILKKAFDDAKAVSLESNFITELTAGDILAKAERQASSVKERVGEFPESTVKNHPAPHKKDDEDNEIQPVHHHHQIKPVEEKHQHVHHVHQESGNHQLKNEEKISVLGSEKLETSKGIADIKPEKKEWEEVLHKMPPRPKSDLGDLKSEVKLDHLSRLADRSKGMPSAEQMIDVMKSKKFGKEAKINQQQPSAEKLVEEEIFFSKLESQRQKDISKEKVNKSSKDNDVKSAENLYEELMKKGTLRESHTKK